MADLVTDGRDAIVRFWSSLHEATYRVTGGRALGRVLGMPVVRLTTTGRLSGEPRVTILAAPVVEDDRIVLVASNGGDDREPQWYRNLVAHPAVRADRAGVELAFRARVAQGRERTDLWRLIRNVTPVYEVYQRRTTRELPVVVLEPDGADAGPTT